MELTLDHKHFFDRLNAFRSKVIMSDAQAASLLGVSCNTLTRWKLATGAAAPRGGVTLVPALPSPLCMQEVSARLAVLERYDAQHNLFQAIALEPRLRRYEALKDVLILARS